MSKLRWNRPLGSYAKIQQLVSPLIRNQRFQLRRHRIRGLEYLDLGAGANTHDEFINVDFQWRPDIDVCWDISRGLPFEDHTMKGAFTEHVLEHLHMADGLRLLRETHRVLKPGGRLRIVVPDAELYIRQYSEGETAFPYGQTKEGISSPLIAVNQAFYQDRTSPWGHVWMYDFELLSKCLRVSGFTEVRRCAFGEGQDPTLLIDTPSRAIESLYAEAVWGGNDT